MHTNLTINTPIYTSDGDQVGTVKELRGDLFKVDAPMQPDYWLACDSIASTSAAGVRLAFTRDHIDEHMQKIDA